MSNVVLRRKVKESRTDIRDFPVLPSMLTAFTKALSGRARRRLGTLSEAEAGDWSIERYAAYIAARENPALIAVFGSARAPSIGAICLDGDLLYHLVDIAMGGDPEEDARAIQRTPTELDRSIAFTFSEEVISAFCETIDTVSETTRIDRLCCSRFESQFVLANIAQENTEMLIVRLNLRIGEAGRRGTFDFVVPLALFDPIKSSLQQVLGIKQALDADRWNRHMVETVLQAELAMRAVLDRKSMKVAELARLQVGDVLVIPAGNVHDVELEVETAEGPVTVARGSIGGLKHNKAIKLANPVDGAFLGPLRRVV